MKKISKLSVFMLLVMFFLGSSAYAQTNFINNKFDTNIWDKMSVSEREIATQQLKFEILHERRTDLNDTLDLMMSYSAPRATLSSENLLGIPLRVGTMEVSALFKKARGSIVKCESNMFEGVFDEFRIVVTRDPNNLNQVVALITGGNNPNVPTEPIAAKVSTDGKTAKVVIGEDWVTMTYKGKNKYIIRTNRVPVKIKAKYVD